MEKFEPLFKINIKDQQLFVIYNKLREGLHNYFSSDRSMYEYIQQNPAEALIHAIQKVDEKIYLLNIASTQEFGAFEWKCAKDIADRQLTIFIPIIQRFMVAAMTESLELQEQE